jgi:peptide/nickel transport system permease protein
MTRLILSRVASAIPVLFVMTFLTFFLASLVPGNAAIVILGQDATPEKIAALNEQLGLDQPIITQYLDWISAALRGDLGTSLYSGEPVTKLVGQRFFPTLWLSLLAAIVSGILGIVFGVFAAIKGGALSRILDGVGMLGISLPNFWIALLLIVVISGQLGLLPSLGYTAPEDDFGDWLAHMVLPVAALGIAGVALVAKQARDAYADALSRDFMRFMQANGISRRSLVLRHGLRYASVPMTAAVSVTFINFFGATAALEQIFAIPGLGSAVARGTLNHDLVQVQGIVLVYTIVIVLVTLLTDIVYAFLNPKIGTR